MRLAGCCCDGANLTTRPNLAGLGKAGSVVHGRTCPDGTYLNAVQVQAGIPCPPVQSNAPQAAQPTGVAPQMSQPLTVANEYYVPNYSSGGTSNDVMLVKDTAAGGTALAPIQDEMQKVEVTNAEEKSPWWLLLLAAGVYFMN